MDDLENKWKEVAKKIQLHFNKENLPDLNAILFLIGIRELGVIKNKFTKEEKQDLMHIAVCRLLSEEGYYELDFVDQDGWPHWSPSMPMEKMSLGEQENLLKVNIIRYFEEIYE